MRSIAFVIAIALAVAAAPAVAQPRGQPVAELRVESRQAYVGMPFVLTMIVEGFDESPPPSQPSLTIAGARVSAMGATPNVSRQIIVQNGRREEFADVTWLLRWRVDVAAAGELIVPAITVAQGAKKASTKSARLRVAQLPTTDDMKIEVALPDRPVWVGETINVPIRWLLRRDPGDQSFSVPLLAMDDAFAIAAPPAADPRKAIGFPAGGRDLQLPFARDDVTIDGKQYARLSFDVLVSPKKAGTIEIPPASVAATLETSGRRDVFGNAPTKLFRVADVARTLVVKPLPASDRPASFAGAVGTSFSIATRTSRSVVQLGEPMELAIAIRGDQRLDNLSLGRLDGPGGLPRDKFTVPADPPPGTLSDDGKTKTFNVAVQVVGPATEIPAIAFAYFDPVKATYQTVHSEPIAVSVKGGGTTVGAGDVVAVPKDRSRAVSDSDATDPAALSLVGADLALSSPGDAMRTPLGGTWLWIVIGLLYAVPLGVFGFRTYLLRTRVRRDEAGEVTAARRRVDDAIARAATAPARDSVGELIAATRALARTLGRDVPDAALLARIETEAFAPDAATSPLAAPLRHEVRAMVERMQKARSGGSSTRAATIVAVVVAIGGRSAAADPLADGRAAYQQAMVTAEPAQRRASFATAAEHFARAVAERPGRPELLADWGNAALGAGDVGIATLAYRRALAIDRSSARAARNLAWLRGKLPDNLRAGGDGAAGTLVFFHAWPQSRRLLIAAIAFAIAVLLVVPWRGRSSRGLAAVAVVPGAIWIAMTASVVLEDRRESDAVIVDGVVVRAADSAGAPAALAQPLPPGTEVEVVERRDGWFKIRLPSGTTGWVPSGTLATIVE